MIIQLKKLRRAKDFAFSNKTSEEFENSAKKLKNVIIKKYFISNLDTR